MQKIFIGSVSDAVKRAVARAEQVILIVNEIKIIKERSMRMMKTLIYGWMWKEYVDRERIHNTTSIVAR